MQFILITILMKGTTNEYEENSNFTYMYINYYWY